MTECFFKITSEFQGRIQQQISGNVIGTKFVPTYACIFMGRIETDFLNTPKNESLLRHHFTNDVFVFFLSRFSFMKIRD